MADPPEQMLPLAAAGNDNDDNNVLSPAVICHVQEGRIKKIITLPVIISFSEHANGLYRVSGRLSAPLPENLKNARLRWLIRIETSDGPREPVPGMHGCSGEMFWAAFGIPNASMVKTSDLKVRIIADEP